MHKFVVGLLLVASLDGMTLVSQGKSSYTIVIATNASPSEQRASRELQRFIGEISGVRLPVLTDDKPVRGNLILVGDSAALRKLDVNLPFDELGTEGFVLRTIRNHLVIAGGRQRGTMYGVYTFLDRLGCRWFTPEVSRIPKLSTIETDKLDEIHKPAFEYREPFFTEAWDKDWAARNRTNGDHTQLDTTTGGKLQYYPFVHSFYELLPPAKYFAEHPEYYSLIDGKRRTERGQLCLTNAAVLKIAIAQVEKWIEEHPEASIFSVSQNDWEGWCECDNCRRAEQEEGGEHSGPLLRFVNAVAEEVGKRHPDKLIDTLAYWYTENPPLKVRPAPNVRIRLCPIGICVSHSFAQCPRSTYFYKNLQAWSKITKQLYIWHYNTNFSHYLLPFPDFDELAADIPLYQRNGVVGLFMQGAYAKGGGGENSELRGYVLARQLWDPSIDFDGAINEFMYGVYGTAGKPMREYFDLLQKEVGPPDGRHLWIFNVPEYSKEFRTRATALFQRAEAVADDDATRRRVQKARLPVDYYEFLQNSTYEVNKGFYGPTSLDQVIAAGRDLLTRMRSFGIESIHEGQELNKDAERLAQMKRLPDITLENQAWRVDIVPALNARVVRMIDRSTGRDALRRFPPGEGAYPNIGGQLATVHSDYYAKAWDVNWSVESQSAEQLSLIGQAANGAKVQRVFELNETGLRTSTIVENGGSAALPAALQVRAELAPIDIDTAEMSFKNVSGEQVRKPFIVQGEPPTGKETWSGKLGPSGEWGLMQTASEALTVRFQDPQIGRSYLNWTAKSRPGVTFGVWSAERRLAPGESVRLDVEYGLSKH